MKTIIMTVVLTISLTIFSAQTIADNWFFSAGIAWHDQKTSGPEIQLDSWLFESEIGRKFKLNENVSFDVYGRHTSGITTKEEGFGLNVIGTRFVAEWD